MRRDRITKQTARIALLLALPLCAQAASTINTTNEYAWGANIGWTNWRPDFDSTNTEGVVIGEFVCSGYVYAANVGWINLGNGVPVNGIQYQNNSATDFGVNYGVDPNQPDFAILRGFAYGANIGWINFEATGNPRLNLMTGNLEGYAYSANCGWINLGQTGSHFLVTNQVAAGADTDGDGMPDAFELLYFGNLSHNGSADTDGDGMSDLQEYLAGTDPTQNSSALRIKIYTANSGGTSSTITWTSTTSRLYTIQTSTSPAAGTFVDDTTFSYPIAPDSGTQTVRTVTATSATKRFYRVKVIRPLFP